MLVTLKGGGKSKRVRQLTCWLQPLIACTLLLQIVLYILFEIHALDTPGNGLGWMVFPPFIVWFILDAIEICCTMPPARLPAELCKLTGSTLLALLFFGVKFVASMNL